MPGFVEVRRGKGVHVVARRTPEEQVSVQVAVDAGIDAGRRTWPAQVEQVRRELTADLRLDGRRAPLTGAPRLVGANLVAAGGRPGARVNDPA